MKMYSRDDLMKNNFGTEDDDDEDDEDEDDNFPKNLVMIQNDLIENSHSMLNI